MRRILLVVIVGLSTPVVVAQDEEREVPLPYVTLVQPPSLPKLKVAALPQERVDEIERLIDDLSGLKSKDIGLLKSSPFGTIFVPVGEFGDFGERSDRKVESFEPIRKLIEIGPDALPYLLEALDDHTPTEFVVQAVKSEGAITGGMAFDEILHGNPANPTERFVLRLNRDSYTASIRPKDSFFVGNEIESYRVKIGDVCLVIVGQIVGRDYECLFHDHVKSSSVVVCSPVHRPSIRDRVRKIWSTTNSRQKVLESLLLDYSTRGLLQSETDGLDTWGIGSDFQIEAAMRLLYYYPDETGELIANRLTALDVSEDWSEAFLKNGVRTDNLIEAVGWSKNRHVRSALATLSTRAKDNDVIRSLKRAGHGTDEPPGSLKK